MTHLDNFVYFLFEVLFNLVAAESLPSKDRGGGDWLGYFGPVLAQPSSCPAHQTEQFVADISPCRQHHWSLSQSGYQIRALTSYGLGLPSHLCVDLDVHQVDLGAV